MASGPVSRANTDPALAALNTLMIHGLSQRYQANKSAFFVDLPEEAGLNRDHRPVDVTGGVKLWRGFFSSVRPTLGSLLLNLDTITGAFVKEGALGSVCLEIFQGWKPNQRSLRGLSLLDRNKVNAVLKGCTIEIEYDMGRAGAMRKMKHKVKCGLTALTPRTQTFEFRENDGSARTIRVEQYYLEQYNIRLQHPDLPNVETKAGTYFPIELCSLPSNNKYNKPLSPKQIGKVNRLQRIGYVRTVFRSLQLEPS